MTTDFDPKSLKVSDLMTPAPATVDEGLGVADAYERMHLNKIRHLVVTRGNTEIVGVVSARDVSFAGSFSKEATVQQAMTVEPYTCAPSAPLLDVVSKMEKHRYGCTVVVEEGKPVGMFTTVDALRAVRSLIAGNIVEPLVPPTHITEAGERERVERARLGRGSASPSPNQGRIG